MSAVTRKRIRDAAVGALSDVVTGFNARLAALATDYGITPFVIDFGPTSRNFLQSYLSPDQVDFSNVATYPAMVVYTASSENTNIEKFRLFSGQVELYIDVYLRYRQSLESRDTESIADAVEDALTQILNDPLMPWPATVAYNGGFRSPREPLALLGDGYEQRIPVQLLFEVNI